MSLTIEHKGYTVFQAENNHVTLSKNGKRIAHAQCDERHTEESLHQYADNFLDLLTKLDIDLSNENPTSTVVLSKPVVDPKVVNHLAQPARFPSQKEVEQLRQKYPIGTRILLIQMDDPYAPVSSGTRGSVEHIDDAGQIHMAWDNGRTLPLVPDVDTFRKLTASEEVIESEMEDFCKDMLSELSLPDDFQTFHINDRGEHLCVRLTKQSDSDELCYSISFVPEIGEVNAANNATANTDDYAELLRACRRVLSLYNK